MIFAYALYLQTGRVLATAARLTSMLSLWCARPPFLLEHFKSQRWLQLPIGSAGPITKWANHCTGWKWLLLRKYTWNKKQTLFCENAPFLPSALCEGIVGRCSRLPMSERMPVASPKAVFFVVFLLSTGKPRLSPPLPPPTLVLLNTEPPSSHYPNSTFQPCDFMVRGASPPATLPGCLLTLAQEQTRR